MSNLTGKVVLVTGAGGGIGRAACRVLAKAGATLVVSDVLGDAANETLAQVRAEGGAGEVISADMTSEDSVAEMVERTISTFGRIDGAFNNAGREGHNLAIADLPLEHWNAILTLNLTGVFLCLKYQIPAMLRTGGGSIVITASALGVVGSARAPEYCASKAGVIGLMKAAAYDYGDQGIRINAVLPGIIRTPAIARLLEVPEIATMLEDYRLRHSMKRFGEPAEIGETVAWLLSDASSYVHGSAMAVDGGFLSA